MEKLFWLDGQGVGGDRTAPPEELASRVKRP